MDSLFTADTAMMTSIIFFAIFGLAFLFKKDNPLDEFYNDDLEN